MNFYDAMIARLTENGMFDTQAKAVMELVVNDQEHFASMQGRWGDQVDGYPQGLVNTVFALIRPVAFKWISEHAPKAWFRVAFAPGIEGLQGKELDDFIKKFHAEQQ